MIRFLGRGGASRARNGADTVSAKQSPAGGAAGGDDSTYARWVEALRRWASEPSSGLGSVPTLTEDTFDQATYGRLMAHVHSAISTMMGVWSKELVNASSRARTPQDLATEMIRLRRMLEPRVHFARHSAWPEQIRSALWDALVIDIETMQHDLEEALSKSTSRGGYDRAATDLLVATVRRDPLTAVLRQGEQPVPVSTKTTSRAPLVRVRPARSILTESRSLPSDRPLPSSPSPEHRS